ncbi:hypothetical protein IQ268_18440 [Oculatella sp. LEGE 06141]|uniref:hypothetical protein n=1 Tax=Oculatella sp. LEGE 06141 TaxID=1828648 RepID=UPI0018825EBB|nr:hypothetical protein [Oculatella sp. LEGE 06141]MBE9180543.1 hypothetical protein [Oculatella sp. LEGE 06141]
MRSAADFSDQQRLQAIANLEAQYRSEPIQPSLQSTVIARLRQTIQAFIVAIAGSSEPQIRQLRDRDGNVQWRSYDPITGQINFFSSEVEVRTWLEQRYYR